MATVISRIKYPDVEVSVHKDTLSGLCTFKMFFIHKNHDEVRDRLKVMAFKHDLTFGTFAEKSSEPIVVCKLKTFKSVNELSDYIQAKFYKTSYSFRLKGNFALVNVCTGENRKYIYQIKAKEDEV